MNGRESVIISALLCPLEGEHHEINLARSFCAAHTTPPKSIASSPPIKLTDSHYTTRSFVANYSSNYQHRSTVTVKDKPRIPYHKMNGIIKRQETQDVLQRNVVRVVDIDSALLIADEAGGLESLLPLHNNDFYESGEGYYDDEDDDVSSCYSVDSIEVARKRLGTTSGFYNNDQVYTNCCPIKSIAITRRRTRASRIPFSDE